MRYAATWGGTTALRFERAFVDTTAPRAATLRSIIAGERPDVIVVDDTFSGATASFLDGGTPSAADHPLWDHGVHGGPARQRPGGIWHPPASDDDTRQRYAAIVAGAEAAFGGPALAYADAKLAEMGQPPLPCSVLNSLYLMADAYLLTTVPSFEYEHDELPAHVRFVGAVPPPSPRDGERPAWWSELEGGKPVVLVTQGTAANADFGELVEPTLSALGDRDDLLVLVANGGRPLDNVGGPIPANTTLAEFLDYDGLLPRLSAVDTRAEILGVLDGLAARSGRDAREHAPR